MSNNIFNKLKRKLFYYIFQFLRICKYKIISDCSKVSGKPYFNQPCLFSGLGTIEFSKNVNIGIYNSPFFFTGYCYFESRNKSSRIFIDSGTYLNNNCTIISEGEGIEIGSNTLIGFNVEITDSDFHDLTPNRRQTGIPKTAKVIIGDNVFIGNNVKILKGTIIGNNTVIANSSIVTKSIPENVIAAGCPAKVIKEL